MLVTDAVLSFKVESGQAVQATADLDKLEASAAKAQKAAADLGKANEAAASKVDKGATATAQFEKKLIGTEAASSKVEKSINAATVAVEKLQRASDAAAAAMGKALAERDRLNASGAADKGGAEAAYLEEVEKIIRVTEKWGLTEDEVTGRLNKAKSALDAHTKGLADTKTATSAAEKAMGEMGKGLGNVVDNAVDASGALGEGGLGGVVGDLIKGLKRTIGPAALAGAAFSAASYLAQAAFDAIRPKVKSVDDLLREHEATIRRLGPAYEEAKRKATSYTFEGASVVDRLLGRDSKSAADKLADDVSGAIAKINKEIFKESSANGGLIVESRFAPFYKLINQLRDGKIDVIKFREEVDRIGLSNPRWDKAATELLTITDSASSAAIAISGMAKETDLIGDAFGAVQRAIGGIDSASARREISGLYDKAREGKTGIDDVASALRTLSGTDLNLAGPIGALEALFRQAIATRDAVMGKQVLPTLGTIGPVYSAGGKFIDEAGLQTERANATKSQFQLEQERLERASRGGGGRRASDRVSEFEREIAQIRERTASIEAETKVVGLSTFAAEKYLATQHLEALARKDAIGLTPERIAAIDAETTAYARHVAALEASAEAQRRAEESVQFARDATKGFIDDLRQGLQSGEGFWKSFANAAMNALDRIVDKLLNDVLDALFQVNNAGSGMGGGGGIFGSILGSMFGPAKSAYTFTPGMGLWAKGGAFENGISGFSNSVVDRATPFKFAKGAGIMGEAGPEAIMPLARDAQGRLGVRGGGGGGNSITVEGSSVVIQGNADQNTVAELKRYMDERDRKMMRDLPKMVDGRMDARQTRRTRA